ncbi:MAG TPA: SCO family protein [Pyrinomonadaceae bacterium]|nr:SCO family protein [Pyrinomonadaceae bacterium]
MNANKLLTLLTRAATLPVLALAMMLVSAPDAAARQQRKQPRPAAVNKQQTDYYSCPMHPTVKAHKAGRCPICGMDLRLTHDDGHMSDADSAAPAHDEPAAPTTTAPANDAASAPVVAIPDLELLDQDGHTIHFYRDLVQGKVVAVNFIFTTCTTICPPLGATFARVQKELGERAGRDVRLISISVDPVTDTPERLKAWGAKFHAGPGWTFVTGAKPQIDELLRALGGAVARREDHSPVVLIGNDARGQWTRTYGLAKPSQLVQIINAAAEGRLAGGTKESIK